MKKAIFSLVIAALFTAVMPNEGKAQTTEGFVGELVLQHTDSIQLLPGLYEFWVHNKNNPKEMAFMLSLNDELYTQVIKTKGKKKVEFEGPPMDQIIGDRLLRDYREKLKLKEKQAQAEVDDLLKVPEKEKKKEKKKRLQTLSEAKKELAKVKAENESLIAQLVDILKKRGRQGTYFIYNFQVNAI